MVSALSGTAIPCVRAWEPSKILIVAPHPDDDVILAAGVTYSANLRGDRVKIVYMTNGDYKGVNRGFVRQGEAVNGQARLLTQEDDLIFLGYPDGYLSALYHEYVDPDDVLTSPRTGYNHTYGYRGLGGVDYHRYLYGSPAWYNRPNVVSDLSHLIEAYCPDHIITTAAHDVHTDHEATYHLLQLALEDVAKRLTDYRPLVHKSMVHVFPGGTVWTGGPSPKLLTPRAPLALAGLAWQNHVSLNVPSAMQGVDLLRNLKYQAINSHRSQGGYKPQAFISQFVHKDELFRVEMRDDTNQPPHVEAGDDQVVSAGSQVTLNASKSFDPDGDVLQYAWSQASGPTVTLSEPGAMRPTFTVPKNVEGEVLRFELTVSDGQVRSLPDSLLVRVEKSVPLLGPNLARLALVTASTEQAKTEQFARQAIDGVIEVAPGHTNAEWVTLNEGVNAWIELTWLQPITIDRLILYDRARLDEHITATSVTFSDGSVIYTLPLYNDGSASDIHFVPRIVTAMRLMISGVSVSTRAVGLAEIEVYAPLDLEKPSTHAVQSLGWQSTVCHLVPKWFPIFRFVCPARMHSTSIQFYEPICVTPAYLKR